jgi:hypothetical protein
VYCGNNPAINVDVWGLATETYLGGKVINTVNINGSEYATIRDLIAAYGGSLSSTPTKTYGDIYYKGVARLVNISFYTQENGVASKRLVLQHMNGRKNWTTDVRLIEGANYVSVNYFHKMMCEFGYSLSLEFVDTAPEWIGQVMQLNGSTEAEQYLTKQLEGFKKYPWNQNKIDDLWSACQALYNTYGIQIDPRLYLAIIIQEGTGSFNTSSTNRAADGQHGPEADYAKDLMRAKDLIFNKILGYAVYGAEFALISQRNVGNPGISGFGDIYEYINWYTPKIDFETGTVTLGVYAMHGAWHSNIRYIYEKLAGEGAADKFSDYGIIP